ncbi:MAG TPA: metalloregulator ArsR/SmtB family transcription factor [Bryobacteraceae bacterium]|nr:metalloregulator ArsR/SmtB family transcription factor [Bryobacteraceae bacterium]
MTPAEEEITRFADMFSAMGTGPRLRIMRLLLSAHPDGLVVGDIGGELGIPASTLSHHLEKLKNEDLVKVRREGTYLWYSANAETLQKLLGSCMPSAAHAITQSRRKPLPASASKDKHQQWNSKRS